MRRAKLRDIAGVHAIAAIESHKVRHAGAIKISAVRLRVFVYIDVGFYHVAPVVDVVAELTRDMICPFRLHDNDPVVDRKPRLPVETVLPPTSR